MGAVKLDLRGCLGAVDGISIDPDPNWTFDSLLSELNALEESLSSSSGLLSTFTKSHPRHISNRKNAERSRSAFVMHVSEDEMEDDFSSDEETNDRSLVPGKRFQCNDIYLSDESNDESPLKDQPYLMDEVTVVEGSLFELNQEYQFGIKEEIRNQVAALEDGLLDLSEKSKSALTRIEKYIDARRDMDRKIDTQYQRKIAEALDNHLTAIQRDHELKSQIEERRLRNDAAHEEAKRKEKASYEEKLRQERAKAEAEAKLKAEEAKRNALEAERKAREAAEREAAEKSKKDTAREAQKRQEQDAKTGILNNQSKEHQSGGAKDSASAGDLVKAAKSALSVEEKRLQKFREIDEQNQAVRRNSSKDFSSSERHISRLIRQIRGIKDNVNSKASDLVKILKDPTCPQSISTATFANKVVSHCQSPDNAPFASAYVIVLVASQVPYVMDIVLAEFHRACIFTIPKYISYSKAAFESREAHYKSLGFREDDGGKIENVPDYLKRLQSYMKLYGALVQTEVGGVQNPHGLAEGWAWLARFLNALPANIFTAVALSSFLQMAGYALFKKYRLQFMRILNVISKNYLDALRKRKDSELNSVIIEIQSYIQDRKFLQVPVGRVLETSLQSRATPGFSDSNHHHHHGNSSYNQSSNYNRYYDYN